MPCSLCHALYAMLSMPCSHCFNLITTFLLLPSLSSHYFTLVYMFLYPCSLSCTLLVTCSLPFSCFSTLIASHLMPCSHHCTLVAKLFCYGLSAPLPALPFCDLAAAFFPSLSFSHHIHIFCSIPHFQISPSHSIPCHVSCSILCASSHTNFNFIPP